MKQLVFILSFLLLSLAFAEQNLIIAFTLKNGDTEAHCNQVITLGSAQTETQLLDARLFISNIEVITAEGSVPVDLVQDGIWQYQTTALLDFEDATGMCQGNADTNTKIKGVTTATSKITGLKFTVGVPEALNHLDAATAVSPLNITDMWWVWRTGYKFLRIDAQSKSMVINAATEAGAGHDTTNAYFIHLGSTECMSDTPTQAPTQPCGNSNRIQVVLNNFNPETNTVVLDLSVLLSQIDVSTSLALEPPGCMSGPDDPDCATLFESGFGLSLETGQQLVESPAFIRVE